MGIPIATSPNPRKMVYPAARPDGCSNTNASIAPPSRCTRMVHEKSMKQILNLAENDDCTDMVQSSFY